MTIKEKTLIEALAATRLAALPNPLSDADEKRWVLAIALVMKADNTENYAVVERAGDNSIIIKRDFGNIAMVRKVISLHPYAFGMKPSLPKSASAKDTCAYLNALGEDGNAAAALLSTDGKSPQQIKAGKELVKEMAARAMAKESHMLAIKEDRLRIGRSVEREKKDEQKKQEKENG